MKMEYKIDAQDIENTLLSSMTMVLKRSNYEKTNSKRHLSSPFTANSKSKSSWILNPCVPYMSSNVTIIFFAHLLANIGAHMQG
jgi:hypothetical protein